MGVVFFPFLIRRLLLAAPAAPDLRSPSNNTRVSIEEMYKKKCNSYKELRITVKEQYSTMFRIRIILSDLVHHWIRKAGNNISIFSIDGKNCEISYDIYD